MNNKEFEISGWHEFKDEDTMQICTVLQTNFGEETPILWNVSILSDGYEVSTGRDEDGTYDAVFIRDEVEARVELSCMARNLLEDCVSEDMIECFKELVSEVWNRYELSNPELIKNFIGELIARTRQWD